MDGEWHLFRPSQSLRIEGSQQFTKGMDSQKWTGISAAYNGHFILIFKPTQRVCHLNIDTQPHHFPTNCSCSRSCTYQKHTNLPKQQMRCWCHYKNLPLHPARQRMLRVLPERNNEPWHLQTNRLSKPAIRPVHPHFRIALTLKKIFMEFAKVED